MRKVMMGLLLIASTLLGEVINIEATPEFVNSTDMKIIDVRTRPEWIQTGIVKGSYTLTFFDERGNYDVKSFLKALNQIVKRDEKFALICRTGSRTGMISNFLGNKLNYHVVNLRGGIMRLIQLGYKPVPYNSKYLSKINFKFFILPIKG
jgi:rhodanese-related sulfurtransferase